MAFKRDGKGRQIPCQVRTASEEHFVCLMSRRHGKGLPGETDKALRAIPGMDIKHVGSSLKGCMIAEGMADVHVRLGPTSRWDTAAMQALVESAGGRVLQITGEPLLYDRGSLTNPDFVVLGKGEVPWREIVAAF